MCHHEYTSTFDNWQHVKCAYEQINSPSLIIMNILINTGSGECAYSVAMQD